MTTPEAAKLLPCPFCGDDYDKGEMKMFAPQTGNKWTKVTCRVCGASAPTTVWNRRAAPHTEVGWVSVKDRLPDDKILVLVTDTAGGYELTYRNHGKWNMFEGYHADQPKYWQPLPPPLG